MLSYVDKHIQDPEEINYIICTNDIEITAMYFWKFRPAVHNILQKFLELVSGTPIQIN